MPGTPGLPPFPWVASFVLACQRHAVIAQAGRCDQGLAILNHWQRIHAAHSPTGAGAAASWQLTASQQSFMASHGRHGETLIARAELGHPHARYRIALLMATDPRRAEEAACLLTEVAAPGTY